MDGTAHEIDGAADRLSTSELAWVVCPKARVSSATGPDGTRAVFVTGCKAWTCTVCGPRRRAKLVRRIIAARPRRFLTLTVQAPTEENGRTWTPREAFDRTRHCCSRLFQHFQRRTGQRTEYCRVLEQTARRYPHYHYLTRGPFWPIDEIRETWQKLTGAYVVDIRRNRCERTTSYVAKYLQKADAVDFTQRRFATSRRFWLSCPRCREPKCQCRPTVEWRDWRRYDSRYVWQTHVEQISRLWSLRRGSVPGTYWIAERFPGDDLPPEIADLQPYPRKTWNNAGDTLG